MDDDTARDDGRIQTVLGDFSPDQLGITLIHEHILVDVSCYAVLPEAATQRALAMQPVSLKNLTWVRRNWTSSYDNMRLDDIDIAIEEVGHFKRAGGNTIVDAGSIGLGRDPVGLAQVARASGLNIVMGCGYYVGLSHPADMNERTEQQITDEIIRDLTVGVGDTGIRAGFIGEIGCSWPITDNELKVLHAAAVAQQHTGAAISVHIGRHHDAPLDVIDHLKERDADLSRVAICHLDREWPADLDKFWRLADTGCYMEFDTFGVETWVYPLAPMDRLSDAQRIDLISKLIERGHLEQILLSHDLAYKHRLMRFGGSGYDHLLSLCVPQMRRKGVSEDSINTMLVENPKRLLAIS